MKLSELVRMEFIWFHFWACLAGGTILVISARHYPVNKNQINRNQFRVNELSVRYLCQICDVEKIASYNDNATPPKNYTDSANEGMKIFFSIQISTTIRLPMQLSKV